MDNLYIIKDRLNEAMRLRRLNISELAELCGLNKSTVSRYLSGTTIPRSPAIGKLAQALHVSPAWVLGYNVPMEAETKTEELPTLDLFKLTDENRARILAYYQALIDSQEGAK